MKVYMKLVMKNGKICHEQNVPSSKTIHKYSTPRPFLMSRRTITFNRITGGLQCWSRTVGCKS